MTPEIDKLTQAGEMAWDAWMAAMKRGDVEAVCEHRALWEEVERRCNARRRAVLDQWDRAVEAEIDLCRSLRRRRDASA